MSRDRLPAFRYVCSEGHEVADDRPVLACPVCRGGVPCPGVLRLVSRVRVGS